MRIRKESGDSCSLGSFSTSMRRIASSFFLRLDLPGAIEIDNENRMDSSNRIDKHTEDELVAMASKGDSNAFNQLVVIYQNIAYNHAYALIGNPDRADDITQESFIKAFRNISRFRGDSFRSWLLRIVTNTSYDLFRRFRIHPEQSLFPMDANNEEMEPTWLADPAVSVERTVEYNEDVKRLYQVLDELPTIYRSVIILIDLYELDYKEAARILKIPLGRIKSRLARAD